MTREILFRGKRIDNGEWVYGCLLYSESEYRIATSMLSNGENNESIMVASCKVDRDTVCQCTNFTDSDYDIIFEGDIISIMGYKNHPIGKVSFEDGELVVGGKDFEDLNFRNELYFWAEKRTVKVVGNIFDNPEMLEE